MAVVKELRPKVVQLRAYPIQCSADVPIEPGWNTSWIAKRRQTAERRGYDPDKCTRGATINVDGRPYCRQHAGSIAIEILVRENRYRELEDASS